MIIVTKADIDAESPEMARLIALAESFPGIRAQIHRIQGLTRSVTEIYLLGSTGVIPTEPFEEFEIVEKVIRVTEKFRTIGRHSDSMESLGFDYNGIQISQDNLHVFPGVCAVDTPKNLEAVLRALQERGVQTTRAGAYKPRTSPYDFQGHGSDCLPWVFEAAGRHDIRIVAMEITREQHIEEIHEALDASGHPTGVMLQIGTRNAQNFELLKAAGHQADFPVLFKRGMGISLEESLNACEYVASSGNHRVVFCLRGVKTALGDPHRNLVDFAHVPVIQRLTRLPVCIDPSHSVGRRAYGPHGILDIFHATAQGIIAGANMVLVDFHPAPEEALCDGPQALLMQELDAFLEDAALCRQTYEKRIQISSKLQTKN